MRLGRALPVMTVLSAVGTLALARVPPLDAGWTKEAVISAASHQDGLLAAACMVAGGLSAASAARFHLLASGFAGNAHPARQCVAWGKSAYARFDRGGRPLTQPKNPQTHTKIKP